jgi:hypothetical protein
MEKLEQKLANEEAKAVKSAKTPEKEAEMNVSVKNVDNKLIVEEKPRKVAKSAAKPRKSAKKPRKEIQMDENVTVRKMARAVVDKAVKSSKDCYIGNDGHWVVRDGDVIVGISKRGNTGLIKITMPLDKLPQAARKHAKKAVQAHNMVWLSFDTPKTVVEQVVKARIKDKKSTKDYAIEVYGSIANTPYLNKNNKKLSAADQLKKAQAEVKVAQAKVKALQKAKGKKATTKPKTATATA